MRHAVFYKNFCRFVVQHVKVFLIFQNAQHYVVIQRLVRLSAKTEYGGTFSAVEHFYLQQRLVRRKPHLPAKRVHFPHEMTFRRAADCRIARHKRDACLFKRRKKGAFAHARRGKRGFDAGVSRADYNYVVNLFHYLPTQNLSNMSSMIFSLTVSPVISPSAV